MTWFYRLDQPFTHESPHLAGISFCNDWCRIEGGIITIAAGYAWDGCSPKWALGPLVIGTPDGPLLADGWRQTGRASLVHDVLCQFKTDIPVTKSATVAVFDELLRADRWPWRLLYVSAVDWFGPQVFAGDRLQRQREPG